MENDSFMGAPGTMSSRFFIQPQTRFFAPSRSVEVIRTMVFPGSESQFTIPQPAQT